MVNQLDAAKDGAGWLVEFAVAAGPGEHVALAGSFNDWDPEIAPMAEDGRDGVYRCRVTLSSGSYEYKFVIGEEWILDEDNPNFAPNDFGTLNSVLIVG